jgi:membrane protease YdiL (CAAX protease family)
MLRLAAILYAALTAGAVLWCWLADRLPWPLYDPELSSFRLLVIGLGAGTGLGVVVVLLSRLMVARLPWARGLYRFFREALGPLDWGRVTALAVFSSIGEELFFRGAMQPALGLWITTLIFAVLHFPSRISLWPWTVMAGVLGLAFGILTQHTGSVAGATLAHFLINLLNLGHIAQFPAPEENLPALDRAPSMANHEPTQDPDTSHDSDPSAPPGGPGQRAEPE